MHGSSQRKPHVMMTGTYTEEEVDRMVSQIQSSVEYNDALVALTRRMIEADLSTFAEKDLDRVADTVLSHYAHESDSKFLSVEHAVERLVSSASQENKDGVSPVVFCHSEEERKSTRTGRKEPQLAGGGSPLSNCCREWTQGLSLRIRNAAVYSQLPERPSSFQPQHNQFIQQERTRMDTYYRTFSFPSELVSVIRSSRVSVTSSSPSITATKPDELLVNAKALEGYLEESDWPREIASFYYFEECGSVRALFSPVSDANDVWSTASKHFLSGPTTAPQEGSTESPVDEIPNDEEGTPSCTSPMTPCSASSCGSTGTGIGVGARVPFHHEPWFKIIHQFSSKPRSTTDYRIQEGMDVLQGAQQQYGPSLDSLREYCREGVPHSLRARVYAALLNVSVLPVGKEGKTAPAASSGIPVDREEKKDEAILDSGGSGTGSSYDGPTTDKQISFSGAAKAHEDFVTPWERALLGEQLLMKHHQDYFIYEEVLQEVLGCLFCARPPVFGSCYLVAPLCFVFGESTRTLYAAAQAMFQMFWNPLLEFTEPRGSFSLSGSRQESTLNGVLGAFMAIIELTAKDAVRHCASLGLQAGQLFLPWILSSMVPVLLPSEVLLLWDMMFGHRSLLPIAVVAAALFVHLRPRLLLARSVEQLRMVLVAHQTNCIPCQQVIAHSRHLDNGDCPRLRGLISELRITLHHANVADKKPTVRSPQ